MFHQRTLPYLIFLVILLLTIAVYWLGLSGGFLFDDAPNLSEMTRYGDMSQWESAKKFILNGIAGPTGRPISLLSFVPQADDWLANNARPFKIVNLSIHLLCGILLFWVTRLLLQAYGETKQTKIMWIAVVSSAIWLLHPMMLSTTLYVIQRMTQLPLLFSLLAMLGYLYGREKVLKRPYFAYTLMTFSIGVGTLLATFSKENGALLPLLVLVIEFCNPNNKNKPRWQWRAVCLWLPSIALMMLLASYIDLSSDPWLNRNFNQIERLFSEMRIVTEYLIQLFVPRIEGDGFFQDGYEVSKGWLSPMSTLYSFIFLCSLFCSALIFRRKFPYYALAVLFFFAAHLMESTFIGLELIFEHRNYIAAIFLFLPVVVALYNLSDQIKPSVVVLISVIIILFLSFLTWQRALLWSDEQKLMLYWAQNSPNSPRAQSLIADKLVEGHREQEANQILEKALLQRPESGLLTLQLLTQKIKDGTATDDTFKQVIERIQMQRADIQAAIATRDLMFYCFDHPVLIKAHGDNLIAILQAMLKNKSYLRIKDFESYALFLQGRILTMQGHSAEATNIFLKSLAMTKDVEDGLNMAVLMGNAGYLKQGLLILDKAEQFYKIQPKNTLKRSGQYYDELIRQTRHDMENDLNLAHKQVKS